MWDELAETLRVRVLAAHASRLGTDWRATNATAPFGRLYWPTGGAAEVVVGGAAQPLRPGVLTVIPAHTPFAYTCPKRLGILWIHFDAVLPGGGDLFRILDCPTTRTPREPGHVTGLFRRLARVWHSGAPGEGLETRGLLLQLLAVVAASADPEAVRRRRDERARFAPVLARIEADPGAPLRVADLAAVIHLEPAYFSRRFRDAFGAPPAAYVRARRVEAAERMLWRTDRTVESIARALGFTDAFHLSRTFKRLTGLSPTAYRRAVRRGGP